MEPGGFYSVSWRGYFYRRQRGRRRFYGVGFRRKVVFGKRKLRGRRVSLAQVGGGIFIVVREAIGG